MLKFRVDIANTCSGYNIKKKEINHLSLLVLQGESIQSGEINIILVNDDFIIDLNKRYFNKNSVTDVISFNLDDSFTDDLLEGEVYIDTQQIARQAKEYETSFDDELNRIVIHGILHIIGYDDQSKDEKRKMTDKEDYYLSEFNK